MSIKRFEVLNVWGDLMKDKVRKPIYKVSKKYIVRRTPNGKFNDLLEFQKLAVEEKIDVLRQDKKFREALFIASTDLYETFITNDICTKEVLNSIIKYYIRYTTRATPFGLFSKCGILTDSSEIKNFQKTVIEVSKQWISELVKKLEEKDRIVKKLKLKVNSSLYSDNYRINDFFGKSKQSNNPHRYTIIINDFIADHLKYIGNKEVSVSNLIKFFTQKYKCNEQVYLKVLKKTLKKNIFYTNLRCHISSNEHLVLIMQELKSIDEKASAELSDLLHLLEYTNQNLSEKNLERLTNTLKKITKSKRYLDCSMIDGLKCDMSLEDDRIKIIEKFADYANCISFKINEELSGYRLFNFKSKFLEKYGYDEEVPVLSALDQYYEYLKDNENEIFTKSRTYIKIRNYIYNLIDKSNHINLDSNFFKGLYEEVFNEQKIIGQSLELFTTQFGDDDKYFYLSRAIGSLQAGSTISRFYNEFPEKYQKFIVENNKRLNNVYNSNNIKLVNLLPDSNSLIAPDVIPNHCFTDEVVTINEYVPKNNVENINFDDILIGINKSNRIYYKKIGDDRQIEFTNFSNLNNKIVGEAYDFLITSSRYNDPYLFLKILICILEPFHQKPAIFYNKLQVFPKQLVINYDNQIKNFDSIEYAKEYFKADYFYIQNGDNRLLICTNIEEDREILKKELKRMRSLTLNGVEKDLLERLNNERDIDYSEKVYQLFIEEINESKKTINIPRRISEPATNYRTSFPFEQWTQFNIYMHKDIQNHFLTNYLLVWIKQNKVSDYFFIKYKDEKGNHIRFRVNKLTFKLMEDFLIFLRKLKNDSFIYSYEIVPYRREIERYGNCVDFGLVENHFVDQSKLSMNLIGLSKLQIDFNVVVYCINALKIMDVDFTLVTSILGEKRDAVNDALYRKISKDLLAFYKNYECIKFDYTSLKVYSIELKGKNVDSYKKTNILFSMIHMLCNRVYGIDRTSERRILDFTRKFLKTLSFVEESEN